MSLSAPLPVNEFGPVTKARFAAEVQAAGEPAILRGQAADWPIVAAGRDGRDALSAYLAPHLTSAPVRIFEAEPEAYGFFTYTDDVRDFGFTRREDTVGGLLARLAGPATARFMRAASTCPAPCPRWMRSCRCRSWRPRSG